MGNEILSDFDGKLLNHHISKVEYPTGTVQVELDNEGVPYYDIRENVAWDNIPFTDSMKGLAQRAKAVCFGSLSQRNIVSRTTIHQFLYNPQIEMFARFKMKSSFHKTKRII